MSLVAVLLGLGYVLLIPIIGAAMLVIALFERLVKSLHHAHVENFHRPSGNGLKGTIAVPFRSFRRHRGVA